MKRAIDRVNAALRACFEGSVATWPLALFRIVFASIVIARSNDFTRGFLHFDHHYWVTGIEYDPAVDFTSGVPLRSPLVPGLALGVVATRALVWLRSACSVSLLLGVQARWSAALLGGAGWWLMAADRYRYLHHLHLLWLTSLWLALVPSGERWSLPALLRSRAPELRAPRWSLQGLRLLCSSVYLSAGTAKLAPHWLSGDTLRDLERVTLIGGPVWLRLVHTSSYGALASLVCVLELALVPLLWWRKTRLIGVALGVLFHLLIPNVMQVATFNAQMIALLMLFAIPDRAAQAH